MVTNNAPFCHQHLQVKVKKHNHHSWASVWKNGDKGKEDGRQWRGQRRSSGEGESCQSRYRINLFTGAGLGGRESGVGMWD